MLVLGKVIVLLSMESASNYFFEQSFCSYQLMEKLAVDLRIFFQTHAGFYHITLHFPCLTEVFKRLFIELAGSLSLFNTMS
jgi:hypothetical protein